MIARIMTFLKSPAGNLALLAGLVVVGGILIYRSGVRQRANAVPMSKVEGAAVPVVQAQPESILRTGFLFKRPSAPSNPAVTGAASASDAADAGRTGRTAPPKQHVLPISLVTPVEEKDAPPSHLYAPYGRLIPCETVVTIESSKLDTPVIGLVTEDVWHNGELIVPAGTEVHGRAALDRSRERIAVSGKWVLVWRDGSLMNGTELVLNGIALDRQRDDVTGEFGLRDGSAGLLGTLFKTDDWAEIKLFAATFLSGMASGLQQLQTEQTLVGLSQVPEATGRNAALLGTSDVLNAYAHQIQEAIERDGFYVRVPTGKQFYIYVTETIDLARATRGEHGDEDIWRRSHESN
jgi:hypothetical protein